MEEGPGPGQYETGTAHFGAKIQTDKSRQTEKLLPARKNYTVTPGPGMYEESEAKKLTRYKSPSAIIGGQKR